MSYPMSEHVFLYKVEIQDPEGKAVKDLWVEANHLGNATQLAATWYRKMDMEHNYKSRSFTLHVDPTVSIARQ